MAKKSKKLIKLNNKIKYFFGDLGFDAGITLVDTTTLMELSHALGMVLDNNSKPELVRAIRRLYSEGDIDLRQLIVEFFEINNVRYLPQKGKDTSEKIDVLTQISEELELDEKEFSAIVKAFEDTRTRKINKEKVLAKLDHIRYENKKDILESTLRGKFDIEDRFEFSHSFLYELFGEKFSKIHILKTITFDINVLKNESDEELLELIKEAKNRAVIKFSQLLTSFLATLDEEHKYLSKEQILYSLKSSTPDEKFYHVTLSKEILTSIISQEYKVVALEQEYHDILLSTSESIYIAKFDMTKEYTLHVHLNLLDITKAIWTQKPLNIHEYITHFKATSEEAYLEDIEDILKGCEHIKLLLSNDTDALHVAMFEALNRRVGDSLHVGRKIVKKVIRELHVHFQEQIIKRQKEQFLARTIRDFKNLFPSARELRRELILHVGPTNSGKTYQAFEALKKADTGYYLAPLRLLALEGYESLLNEDIEASLITGEEQIIDEEATHISSTIEMLNFDVDVDVCVIDEVQMLDDRDRGWAWANAIIGAPAKKVIMTGSINAKEAVIALAKYLNEPLTIVEFERKNPLELLEHSTPISAIQPQTAIIAFSRRDVLKLRTQLNKTYKVSVIYGNLSPEVRREEARRFREGETDIMVATDAIAMGLNLPIQTVLFYKAGKFDGENQRDLYPNEVHQIAGRAGRYGLSEKGYVGALDMGVLKQMHRSYKKHDKKITIPFDVMANLEHIKLVGSILEEESLLKILDFFVTNMKFTGPFRASNLESMIESAEIVDKYPLDLSSKYHLSVAPITTSSPYVLESFERYVRALAQGRSVAYIEPKLSADYAESMQELLEVEDRVKEISLYLWLSYRFEDKFIDSEKAKQFRGVLNRFIENSLKESHFVPRCRMCTKVLPVNSEFAICNSCFRKQHKRVPRRNSR